MEMNPTFKTQKLSVWQVWVFFSKRICLGLEN